MMLEAGLVGARFVHLACVIISFGAALFPLYSCLSADSSERLGRQLNPILITAALGALLSGLAWFGLTVANMSGELADAVDRDTLASVLWDTDFGHVWAVRAPLMILLVAAIQLPGVSHLNRRTIAIVTFLAAILLVSLAGIGHTQVNEGTSARIHVTSDVAHLLAAGAWLGGLLPLSLFLASNQKVRVPNRGVVRVLSRFSGMGYAAVAILLASGSINSWFLVGSLSHLISTTYGQLLLVKSGLFVLMVLLAAANRFWLVPAMAQSPTANGSESMLAKLRGHVLGEQVVGLVVVGVVSVLGTLDPAMHGS
ncbi:copper homeostasis membrane protein CopD [Bradyrhizobium zhanjiangense]|nr:copper homeostasis membrane protein CopD [Bradyrhizobium zhanjiangense]